MPNGGPPNITRTPRSTLVNINREELEQARNIADYQPSAKLKKSSELVGDTGARDYIVSQYRERARPIVMRRSNSVPIFDHLYEVGKGEFVIAEAKANQSPYGKTNRKVFLADEAGVVARRVDKGVVTQFSPEWFRQRLRELRTDFGHEGKALASRLETAWREGKIRALKIRVPLAGQTAEHLIVEDVSHVWNADVGAQARHTMPPHRPAWRPPDPARGLPSGTTDVERGLEQAPGTRPRAESHLPTPTPSPGIRVGERVALTAERSFRARSLVVGLKTWRAVRRIGTVVLLCFVPLKVLDVVIEVAMTLWDRDREKAERKRRDKQQTLLEVFKQRRNDIERGIQAIANGPQSVQAFLETWEKNRNHNGFIYARLVANVTVEYYLPVTGGDSVEALTKYRVDSLNVNRTDWSHEFTIEDVGEAKELEKSEEDIANLFKKGQMYPAALRKMTRQRLMRYTIVPPLLTPFDIVVLKLNNLFLDVARFIAWFSNAEESALDGIESLNFTYRWDEQLSLSLEYPAPLNPEVCKYCLGYIYAAARQISRHPLEQQDLEGNLEDPMKGWRRRFELLQWVLDGTGSKYGKSIYYFAGQIKKLVRHGDDADVAAAVQALFEGARSIIYDLERIEQNMKKPEYFYLGPQYRPGE